MPLKGVEMSKEFLAHLVEERQRAWHELKAVYDGAATEGRDLTVDEKVVEERTNQTLDEYDERIKSLSAREARNAEADEARERVGNRAPAERGDKPQTDEDKLRAMVRGESRGVEFRDLVKGTTTAGGHTVPTSFYGQLVEHLVENSAIRQTNVTVLTTDNGQDLPVPKTTTHPTAGIIAEAGTITESDPVFGQVVLGAFKYGFSTQVATELEQDTGVNLTEYLSRIGGEALANGSGAHFVTGDGSSKPNGVVTASTLGITGSTSVTGAFTAANLIDLYYSVISAYRKRGYWMMGDASLKAARKLRDDSGAAAGTGNFLWAPGMVAGEPDTLLGRPVVNDTNVADPAVGAKSVVFGDFSRYFIRDVRGVRVERSVDFAFGNDLVTWRFLLRTDGDLIDTTGAIKHFIGGAS